MRKIGEYVITDQNISKGAFATIHKGHHCYTNVPVAIKELRVQSITNLKPYVRRELEIHKKLAHPNIVKLYDIIPSSSENVIYIVLEYCAYGDLQKFQAKRPFTEKYVQNYMFQIRDSLKYLYDNNIVHRDLKPQNILLSGPTTIKLTDFGLAREISTQNNEYLSYADETTEDLFSTYCGSPMYMSPEVLNKHNYGTKSDLWSIGVILYELITGYPPFEARNLGQLREQMNEPIKLDKINRKTVSFECYDLLSRLLNIDKKSRISWTEFFEHEWFATNKLIESDNHLIENPLKYDLLDTRESLFRLSLKEGSSNRSTVDNLQLRNRAQSLDSNNRGQQKFKKHLNNDLSKDDNITANVAVTSILDKKKSVTRSRLLSQFTFTLQSSQFSDDSKNSVTDDSVVPMAYPSKVNLSDLKQDDLPADNSTTGNLTIEASQKQVNELDKTPYTQPLIASKPIDIIGSRQMVTTSRHSNLAKSSPSNSSSSTTPSSIKNAISTSFKFIRETYEYLSNNDNNSM